MEPQPLDQDFLKFLVTFYNKDGTRPHDKVNGQCKCGEVHTAIEMQMRAVKEYREKKSNLE